MTARRPLAVFILSHPWLQDMVVKAAPSDFDVQFLDGADDEAMRSILPQADFLMATQLSAKWVPFLMRCKLVQHQGVGYDGIDAGALAAAEIPLAVTPEGTTIGVAEHTILLILALSKQLVLVHESLRRGEYDQIGWRANSHFFFGKTLGIIGFGRIGRRVAHLAGSFDVRLLYYDAVRAAPAVEQAEGVQYLPFDELLPQADIVTVHVPSAPDTRGLFGAKEFARMKAGALFINTSRGDTYDMDALYQALSTGELGGAGLDVFNPEPPPPDHPIRRLPNVICTPHMATGTVEAHLQKAQAQFDNFRRVLHGETPHNLVSIAPP